VPVAPRRFALAFSSSSDPKYHRFHHRDHESSTPGLDSREALSRDTEWLTFCRVRGREVDGNDYNEMEGPNDATTRGTPRTKYS
jgi:hypothetical protein